MLRYICNSYLPYKWMIELKIFYPSLERLADLHLEFTKKNAEAYSLSEEFSCILKNLKINGVWKWTAPSRLQEMDRLLSEYVNNQSLKELSMLDVGGSDGFTSLDTFRHMKEKTNVGIVITMIDRDLYIHQVQIGCLTVYFTSSRRPILLCIGKLGLCIEPMDGFEGIFFNNIADKISKYYAKKIEDSKVDLSKSISLVNPIVSNNPLIRIEERDLFDLKPGWIDNYDVVRVSNVLNFCYYSENKIIEALFILHGYLREGGALLVSRNIISGNNERETGALWTKTMTGFQRQYSLDESPDISRLVDGFRY